MAEKMQFRRIRGRIVPIRMKKDTGSSDRTKGAAIVAAGAGVSWGAGRTAAGMERDAAHLENAARKQAKSARNNFKLISRQGPAFKTVAHATFRAEGREALRSMIESRKAFKASGNLKATGLALGTSLIAGGVYQALSGNRQGRGIDTADKALVAGVAGTTAAVGIRAAYERRFGPRKGFALVKSAFKHVIRKRFGV